MVREYKSTVYGTHKPAGIVTKNISHTHNIHRSKIKNASTQFKKVYKDVHIMRQEYDWKKY